MKKIFDHYSHPIEKSPLLSDESEFPVLNSFTSHRRWDIESNSPKKCSCQLNNAHDLELFSSILDKITTSIGNTITSALQQSTASIINAIVQMQSTSSTSSVSTTILIPTGSSPSSPPNLSNSIPYLLNSTSANTQSGSILPITNSRKKSKSTTRKLTNRDVD